MSKRTRTDTLKEVLKRIKKHGFFLAASLILAAVTVVGTLYIPILTGRGIDMIISPGNVDFAGIGHILAEICVIIGITAVCQWLMSISNNRVAYRVVRDIRNEAFEKLQRLPVKYFDSHRTGDIVSRMTADAEQFADGLLMGFTQLFTGVMTIIGTLLFMLSEDVLITSVVVLITPVSLGVAAFIAKRTFSMFRKQTEVRGEQTGYIEEMIGGQKTVRAFGQEKQSKIKFDEINERFRKCSLNAVFFSSITNPSTRFVNSLVYTGVGAVGAFSVISGGITVGVLSCFLSYANQYTKPFNEISGVITELQGALACADRVFELIEEPPMEPDAPGALVLEAPDGNVSAEQVYFSYDPEKPLIEDFSADVKPGWKVALVGPTGCGKTTVINLLMRFYDADSGRITVDGSDIRNMTRESLRKNYGMVLQETWLKSGTVRENIACSRPDASMEEITAAAKAAHAHSFIMQLPDGYDTLLSEDGEGISQGQKQLLCIARVMLELPPMLILDEATSSIDTRTEQRIQSAFGRMMKGRTCFIVAHRLSTIMDADLILVMRDGHIIEQGNHEALLEKGGFYAELYNSQFIKA